MLKLLRRIGGRIGDRVGRLLPVPTLPTDDTTRRLKSSGNAHLAAGRLAEAEADYRAAIAHTPEAAELHVNLGFVLKEQGRLEEAEAALRRAAARDPGSFDACYTLAMVLALRGLPGPAVEALRRAVGLMPALAAGAEEFFEALVGSGQAGSAEVLLREAVAGDPGETRHHLLLGGLLACSGQAAAAIACLERATALAPDFAAVHLQLGVLLERSGRPAEAQARYRAATDIDPRHAGAHFAMGNLQQGFGHLAEAAACFRRALEAEPRFYDAASNLGLVLRRQGRLEEARQACLRAIAIEPAMAAAHNNLGTTLVELKRPQEALPCFERALALQPGLVDARVNLGHALGILKRPAEAAEAYARAVALGRDTPLLFGASLMSRMGLCDWRGIEEAFAELAERIATERVPSQPFTMLAAPLSGVQQRECVRQYLGQLHLPETAAPPARRGGERIRLGYFSADFHNHATAFLAAELFEKHDRSRFESIAFSFGPASSHPMRRRLESAFDRFIDVAHLSDADLCALARSLEVDIAIDLKGYTTDCRVGVFSRRAAPLQISYLGYPGTMGAPFIDYIVADATVIPAHCVDDYTEKVIFLPGSYQVNDSRREISARPFGRSELGLPTDAFVYCCFNNNFKITPDIFDVWMRLLHDLPTSVLWLLQDNPHAAANLRREAAARGIDPARLVFAPRVDLPEHLARQRQADLFLDTLYCNAHTTASDALWAGLPVLTCPGETFASRVGASLVRAAGLPELVAPTLAEYERLARALAREPARLAELRQRLVAGRDRCALFDSTVFTRQLEWAYEAAWQRCQDGLAPEHLQVPAAARAGAAVA